MEGVACNARQGERYFRLLGVASNAPCSLDISCACFQSPEGRKQNSPGLQAWEGLRKENRPERAADFRALFQKVTFFKSDSMAFQKQKSASTIRCERDRAIKCNNNISLGWRSIPVRPPFQGDSVVRVVPRPEGLGYSLFALRATAKCPNSIGRCKQRPSNLRLCPKYRI